MPIPNYESQYRGVPYTPQQQNPMATFLQSFMNSLQPIMEYKWKKSMEEDADTKKKQMEHDWLVEDAKRKAALAAADPENQYKLRKSAADASTAELALEEAKRKREWWVKQPQNVQDLGYGKDYGVLPSTQVEQGLAAQALPSIASAPGTPAGNEVIRSGLEKYGIKNPESVVNMTDEEQSIENAKRELGVMQEGQKAGVLESGKRNSEVEWYATAMNIPVEEAAKIIARKKYGIDDGDKFQSADALAYQAFKETHPNATATEISAFFDKRKEDAATKEPLLNPDALDFWTWASLAKGGDLSQLGMGPQLRGAIMSRAPALARERGITPESMVAQGAEYQSNKGALQGLKKQGASVSAFARTTEKNFALVERLSEEYDRPGSPVIARWYNAGMKTVAGDPGVAKLNLAVRTAINEYARAVTTVSGGAVTSDAARKEIEDTMNLAMSKGQMKEVISIAREEMWNRLNSYLEQYIYLRDDISNPYGGKPGTPKPKAWGEMVNPAKPSGGNDPLGLR